MRGILVPCSHVRPVALVDDIDDGDPLADVQRHVGGYVQVVGTTVCVGGLQAQLLVDEDGRPKRLAPNPRASALSPIFVGGTLLIVGDCLIVGTHRAADGEHEWCDVPESLIEDLIR